MIQLELPLETSPISMITIVTVRYGRFFADNSVPNFG